MMTRGICRLIFDDASLWSSSAAMILITVITCNLHVTWLFTNILYGNEKFVWINYSNFNVNYNLLTSSPSSAGTSDSATHSFSNAKLDQVQRIVLILYTDYKYVHLELYAIEILILGYTDGNLVINTQIFYMRFFKFPL